MIYTTPNNHNSARLCMAGAVAQTNDAGAIRRYRRENGMTGKHINIVEV